MSKLQSHQFCFSILFILDYTLQREINDELGNDEINNSGCQSYYS